jgi:hypothetical protein
LSEFFADVVDWLTTSEPWERIRARREDQRDLLESFKQQGEV